MFNYILVIVLIVIAFIAGMMVGRHNPKVAEVIGSTVDKGVEKVENEVKEVIDKTRNKSSS